MRWWEYYIVRYFFGTIVGGYVAYLWAFMGDDPNERNFQVLLSRSLGNDVKPIVVLATVGLVFCYIASAPMLTFHSFRAQTLKIFSLYRSSAKFHFDVTWRICGIPLLLLALIAVPLASNAGVFWTEFLNSSPLTAMCFNVFLLMILVQLAIIFMAHCENYQTVFEFYRKLGSVRSDPANDEYVESYRHIREHSNAYAIILFELLLASVLMSARRIWEVGALLFVWIVPAGYCWALGTILEAKLVTEKSEPQPVSAAASGAS